MFSIKDHGFVTDMQVKYGDEHVSGYQTWVGIAHRCYNPKHVHYKYYGAIGVYVCDEWKIFSNFKRWYDENYIEGYDIDKDISGLGYYGPNSCKFISHADNTREAMSKRDNEYLKGSNHHGYKPKEFFSSNPVQRSSFKITCSRQGWDFDNFNEVFGGWYLRGNGKRQRVFLYKEKLMIVPKGTKVVK